MPNSKKTIRNLVSKVKLYLAIIAILMVLLCIYEKRLIIPCILIYALVVSYSLWANGKRNAEISKHIEELTVNIDSAAKSTLINSPFPLVILETSGNIVWRSSEFNREFSSVDINTYLEEITKEIKLEEDKKISNINKEMQIGQKTYAISGKYVENKTKSKKTEYVVILYFIDKTEYYKVQKAYEETQSCVGIIMVDNYEELITRASDELRPGLIAEVEKQIYDFAKETGGLIIKSDRDTFVYVFQKKYLEELEENKFDILDVIKNIDFKVNMPATLSISVSAEGNTGYEKYKYAKAGLDIALGRGGDQAVLRKDGKYSFFGGRVVEVEKRTKVKARVVAHALKELILEAENVMIMGHTNADIDAMGSALGVNRFVKSLGKQGYIVYNSSEQTIENFMEYINNSPEYEEIFINKNEALNKISEDTLLIVVDTHKKNYVDAPELLDETEKIVVIDHHRRSADFIENAILTFHEVYASSAAELVTEILQYADKDIELPQFEAESLYAGIMVDTKNFTFKTGVRTFEAAAYLRKSGVDIIRVKKWFQSDLRLYNKIADIVKKAVVENDTIAIAEYEEVDKNSQLVCAKAADELLTISDVTASFVIGNLGERICISGRSIGDINVQVILEKLGGGGHITVAGAQIEGLTMEEVRQELIIRINEYFTEN